MLFCELLCGLLLLLQTRAREASGRAARSERPPKPATEALRAATTSDHNCKAVPACRLTAGGVGRPVDFLGRLFQASG